MYEPIRPVLERGIRRRTRVEMRVKEGWEAADPRNSTPYTLYFTTANSDKPLFTCYMSFSEKVVIIDNLKILNNAVASRKFLVLYVDMIVSFLVKFTKEHGKNALVVATCLRDAWYPFLRHQFDVVLGDSINIRGRLIMGDKSEIQNNYT